MHNIWALIVGIELSPTIFYSFSTDPSDTLTALAANTQ
jgi:hypothetical protein